MEEGLIGPCTLRRAPRWGILAGAISLLVVGFMYFKNGSMPVVDELLLRLGGDERIFAQLPFGLPRLVDVFAVFLPATLLAGVLSELEHLTRRWDDEEEFFIILIIGGLVCGLLGGVLVAYTGLVVLIACSVVLALAALVYNRVEEVPGHRDYWGLLLAAVAVWLVCTMIVGTIPGLVFALTGLAVASATYVGVWGFFKGLHWLLVGPAHRWLVSCPVEN
jgi:hypothetical protein